jgi:hypothetical protein
LLVLSPLDTKSPGPRPWSAFALLAVFAVVALFAVVAEFAVPALVALLATSARRALGTLARLDSLISRPRSVSRFTFDPVTALWWILLVVTARRFSCSFPTEFAGSVIAA